MRMAGTHTKLSCWRNVSGDKSVLRLPARRWFHFPSEVHMRTLIAVALLSAASFTPASAAMMGCTSDNMMKSSAMMSNMNEGSAKMAANKEMAMANTDMSNGKMGSACKHYMKAQKAAMAK
jgi:hypothetical protein